MRFHFELIILYHLIDILVLNFFHSIFSIVIFALYINQLTYFNMCTSYSLIIFSHFYSAYNLYMFLLYIYQPEKPYKFSYFAFQYLYHF